VAPQRTLLERGWHTLLTAADAWVACPLRRLIYAKGGTGFRLIFNVFPCPSHGRNRGPPEEIRTARLAVSFDLQ
jgi:hypothetical protein